jgi:urease accessory protein
VSVAGLLLGDSRFPAGGHAHSGGVEAAVTAGTLSDLPTLEMFLRGRVRTAGLVAAGLAAAACARVHAYSAGQIMKYPEFRAAVFAAEIPDGTDSTGTAGSVADPGGRSRTDSGGRNAWSTLTGEPGSRVPGESRALVRYNGFWSELDAEADARTPAPAQREASRRQGRALLRAARAAWPDAAGLAELASSAGTGRAHGTGRSAMAGAAAPDSSLGLSGATGPASGAAVASGADTDGGERREYRGGPHHAVVLGAAAAAAGCDPRETARIAAYQAVAGPASAAVRLLALDPMRAAGVLARLAGDIESIAAQGAACADGPLGDLPCPSAPALDLLAETHIRVEVRLFES